MGQFRLEKGSGGHQVQVLCSWSSNPPEQEEPLTRQMCQNVPFPFLLCQGMLSPACPQQLLSQSLWSVHWDVPAEPWLSQLGKNHFEFCSQDHWSSCANCHWSPGMAAGSRRMSRRMLQGPLMSVLSVNSQPSTPGLVTAGMGQTCLPSFPWL